jgi:hypothetical protein
VAQVQLHQLVVQVVWLLSEISPVQNLQGVGLLLATPTMRTMTLPRTSLLVESEVAFLLRIRIIQTDGETPEGPRVKFAIFLEGRQKDRVQRLPVNRHAPVHSLAEEILLAPMKLNHVTCRIQTLTKRRSTRLFAILSFGEQGLRSKMARYFYTLIQRVPSFSKQFNKDLPLLKPST